MSKTNDAVSLQKGDCQNAAKLNEKGGLNGRPEAAAAPPYPGALATYREAFGPVTEAERVRLVARLPTPAARAPIHDRALATRVQALAAFVLALASEMTGHRKRLLELVAGMFRDNIAPVVGQPDSHRYRANLSRVIEVLRAQHVFREDAAETLACPACGSEYAEPQSPAELLAGTSTGFHCGDCVHRWTEYDEARERGGVAVRLANRATWALCMALQERVPESVDALPLPTDLRAASSGDVFASFSTAEECRVWRAIWGRVSPELAHAASDFEGAV